VKSFDGKLNDRRQQHAAIFHPLPVGAHNSWRSRNFLKGSASDATGVLQQVAQSAISRRRIRRLASAARRPDASRMASSRRCRNVALFVALPPRVLRNFAIRVSSTPASRVGLTPSPTCPSLGKVAPRKRDVAAPATKRGRHFVSPPSVRDRREGFSMAVFPYDQKTGRALCKKAYWGACGHGNAPTPSPHSRSGKLSNGRIAFLVPHAKPKVSRASQILPVRLGSCAPSAPSCASSILIRYVERSWIRLTASSPVALI
jgi:hypothetical protein